MKRLLILSTILLGGIVSVKAPPTLQGPTLSGSGGGLTSNQVYQIALTVGGPTNGVTATVAASIAATNVSQGYAFGVTMPTITNNTTGSADRLTSLIAAFYVTNYTENRDSIYVTGADAAAVNGQYKVSWYSPQSFTGVWTNTASTNMIVMNNPSNSGSIASQPIVLAASTSPTDFMYQENQDLIGVRSDWINPITADGMATFSGTATLTWASNAVRNLVVTSWSIGGTNAGIVATNLMVVSLDGDDTKATRLNGYPFKTLYVASTNATAYDLIYIKPGYHKTQPFHMVNRGFHILGAGEDVCVVEVDNLQSGPNAFQSRALIPWDNCSIGNFTITNGLIAFAQFSGVVVGGTNAWAHDLTIYPPRQLKYPDNTTFNPGNGDQSQYYNVGVDVSRIGNDNRIERVKVYGGMRGFNVQTSYSTSGTINMVDCEAYCEPRFSGSPNIWTNAAYMAPGKTNVGGMLPISLSAVSPDSQTAYPFTLNIVGGKFVSFNGGTNVQSYVGGETQASRNAALWISRAYTNTVTINISSIPQFYNGNTNTTSYAVLNESTNNKVSLVGFYNSNYIAQATNVGYQVVYAAGTQATSSSSLETMNFGTTDPQITVAQSGVYAIYTSANGVTSSADTGTQIILSVASNSVTIANSSAAYIPIDSGLSGTAMPWSSAQPVVFSPLVAGDTVALQWQGADSSWAAINAHISIVKIK